MYIQLARFHHGRRTLHRRCRFSASRGSCETGGPPAIPARSRSADHRAHRAAECSHLLLADPGRGIRSPRGVGGWRDAILRALAQLEMRYRSGGGARAGAGGACAGEVAENFRGNARRPIELFEGAGHHPGGERGDGRYVPADRPPRHGPSRGEAGAGLPAGEGGRGPRTAITRWTGEAMDYQTAIDSLLFRERRAADVSAETSAGPRSESDVIPAAAGPPDG